MRKHWNTNRLFLRKKSGLRHIIDDLFASINAYPDISYEIEEDQVATGLVANEFGIAIVPDMPLLDTLNIKKLPLVSPSWHRNFYMATLKGVYQPPVIESFKKFVIDYTSKEFDYKTS